MVFPRCRRSAIKDSRPVVFLIIPNHPVDGLLLLLHCKTLIKGRPLVITKRNRYAKGLSRLMDGGQEMCDQ